MEEEPGRKGREGQKHPACARPARAIADAAQADGAGGKGDAQQRIRESRKALGMVSDHAKQDDAAQANETGSKATPCCRTEAFV